MIASLAGVAVAAWVSHAILLDFLSAFKDAPVLSEPGWLFACVLLQVIVSDQIMLCSSMDLLAFLGQTWVEHGNLAVVRLQKKRVLLKIPKRWMYFFDSVFEVWSDVHRRLVDFRSLLFLLRVFLWLDRCSGLCDWLALRLFLTLFGWLFL